MSALLEMETAAPGAIRRALDGILPRVKTPAQYVGGELNSIAKDPAGKAVAVALGFPDVYEIGMSHLGLQILYSMVNREEDMVAERAYCPWPDMEAEMRAAGIPLYTLETKRPVREYDVLGISVQYELCYTNLLTMLDLAGIPIRARDRGPGDPIVLVGGVGAFTPEPVADFVDLFLVGDAEEVILPILREAAALKRAGTPREGLLLRLVRRWPCLYAPALYESIPDGPHRIRGIRPLHPGIPWPVRVAQVRDFENAPYPDAPIVPSVRTVHERVYLEIMRGCTLGCRFCQAGMIKRPQRYRSIPRLVEMAERSYAATGFEEISLNSLSSSNYPGIADLVREIDRRFSSRGVNVSFPSLRVDTTFKEFPSIINAVRKSGFTVATEAASLRLRRVINKPITDENLFDGIRNAYREGWDTVKLYFMIGHPTETDADVDEIPALADRISRLRTELGKGPAKVNVTVSTFVPKPHTPFQWEPMIPPERTRHLQGRLRERSRNRRVHLRLAGSDGSFLECVMSRGPRQLSAAVEEAWRLGARFDAWDEHLRMDLWEEAFRRTGIDPREIALRELGEAEWLPWDHLFGGATKPFLLAERRRARKELETPECEAGPCGNCGSC